MVKLHGLMGNYIKEITRMIKSMTLVLSLGRMVVLTKASGSMESSTVKGY